MTTEVIKHAQLDRTRNSAPVPVLFICDSSLDMSNILDIMSSFIDFESQIFYTFTIKHKVHLIEMALFGILLGLCGFAVFDLGDHPLFEIDGHALWASRQVRFDECGDIEDVELIISG